MKHLINATILCALLAVTGVSHAGGVSTGIPSNILVLPDQDLVFFSAGTHTGKPACATNTVGTWAISTATGGGKAMYAAVLTALAAGISITVEGYGTAVCTNWSDREDARFFYTQ